MNKTTIPIKGMHCRSCEILIDEKLREIPEIKSVKVSYKRAEAVVYSKTELGFSDTAKINKAIEEAGYEVGIDEPKAWITKDPVTYSDLLVAGIILLVFYFIAKKFGLFNINIGSAKSSGSLLVVLLIGLTAGVSTCMALVGGLILGISAKHAEKHPEALPTQKFRPHLFFNLGRIVSYFILGGIIGLLGKAFQLSGSTLGILTILVGTVMLLVGLQLTELFPVLSNFKLTLPVSVSAFFGEKNRHKKEYSHINSIVTGALTFFLPCGFTQAMQLYAMSTGSFWRGAFILGTFALGTAPGLLSVGGLTSFIKGIFARRFFKFAGILVTVLAIINMSNGLRLLGVNFSSPTKSSSTAANTDPNVKIENGVQIVRMDQLGGGYKPNSITIQKGIPVKWIITSKSQSCAASIYSKKLGISQNLDPGENIIEFTPKETGEIKFSCSMGMYTGKFIVVENSSVSSLPDEKPAAESTPVPSQSAVSSNTAPKETPKPTPTPAPDPAPVPPAPANDVQVIKANFDKFSSFAESDISPHDFVVTAGKPVEFDITANADGVGCMSTIMIPGIINKPELLEKGQTIKWNFTPQKGVYDITCAMGVSRGTLTVI